MPDAILSGRTGGGQHPQFLLQGRPGGGRDAMLFGTVTDEATSFAILDRYVEAGGTFIDTANNYAFWVNGSQGGESEALIGRWRRSRGIVREVVIASKVGARPLRPATTLINDLEGLSAAVIREQAERSRERLGVETIDLYYAHLEDPRTPVDEIVQACAELVADGIGGTIGASNHWIWRVERARRPATAAGPPGYEVLQYHHSYLRMRTDTRSLRSVDGNLGVVSGDHLSYLRDAPNLTLVACSPLLGGAHVRADKPLDPEHDHPGNPARLAALREVAADTGATLNQVVLAWLIGAEVPAIPLVGASSVAQLDESLAAVGLELTVEQRAKLDAAM